MLSKKKKKTYTIIVEQWMDGYLISDVVELPGCHTQAKTYEKLMERTKEAISLYRDVKKEECFYTRFFSLQQIEV